MATVYDIGDVAHITAHFQRWDDTLDPPAYKDADPDTVTLDLKHPDGTVTHPAPQKETTGYYYADYQITDSGKHTYRWSGVGNAQAAEEEAFMVRRQRVVD